MSAHGNRDVGPWKPKRADCCSLAGPFAPRWSRRGIPLLERLAAQHPVRRARPTDVEELAVEGVLGAALDDALLVRRMNPGFVARHEAGAERDALRAETQGARNA